MFYIIQAKRRARVQLDVDTGGGIVVVVEVHAHGAEGGAPLLCLIGTCHLLCFFVLFNVSLSFLR